jgi:hypothetical protein
MLKKYSYLFEENIEDNLSRAGGFCSTRSNFVGGEHNPKCGFTLSLARSLCLSVPEGSLLNPK